MIGLRLNRRMVPSAEKMNKGISNFELKVPSPLNNVHRFFLLLLIDAIW